MGFAYKLRLIKLSITEIKNDFKRYQNSQKSQNSIKKYSFTIKQNQLIKFNNQFLNF